MVKHDDKRRDSAESVEMFIMLQVRPRSLFGFIFVVFHNQRVKKQNLTVFVYITTLMLTGSYFFVVVIGLTIVDLTLNLLKYVKLSPECSTHHAE
ncbi:hypothetical protein YA27_06585 [Klebsiella aerogenes]|nr:hypothetical protein SR83_05185 [Klebsiella aerogenes]KJO46534.1 hypothetical protein SR82_11740 [Klebsiella aerogenes]KJO49266.1 hypothetical protein SR85_13415 [Klebsiella aerogenes]KLF02588.1 hypothetical protein YA25_16665 [Klebsiella aerogenes]KLF15449.1 hypothetical protein YA27_06585 [Klebsiella aerogenes]